jgi:hypothetical protein
MNKPMQTTGEFSIVSNGDIALPNLADIFAATFMIENNAVTTPAASTAQPPSHTASQVHLQPLPVVIPAPTVTVPLPPTVIPAPTVTVPLPPTATIKKTVKSPKAAGETPVSQ